MKAKKLQQVWLAISIAIAFVIPVSNADAILNRAIYGRTKAKISFLSSIKDSSPLKPTASLGLSSESGLSFLTIGRGGAVHLDEEEYDEYDDEEEDEEVGVQEDQADSSLTTTLNSAFTSLLTISKGIMHGIVSSFSTEDDDSKSVSLPARIIKKIRNIFKTALNPVYDNNPEFEGGEESDSKEQATSATPQKSGTKTSHSDFGSYLAQAYGVSDGRKDPNETPVLGGSLTDALKIARSKARLLVVLIPSNAPKKAKKNDTQAITSFLSAEVAKVAKKKARKKEESGSYMLWSAKAGSPEATLAMKLLKVKTTGSKGGKRPILLVAYPVQKMTPKGDVKVAGKVLAQHHCSPPPSKEAMSQWMNELRKRHGKQYAIMQKDVRELQLFKERKEGYKESVQLDVERKIRQAKEEEERLAKEKAEKERLETLERRRAEFLESLPEEPGPTVRDAIIVSVRHADGRNEKRRFAKDTQLEILFNWVDATFKMEREIVVLTTMNGKQTYSWEDTLEDKNLKEAGLGRMVGFRLSEKVEETKEEEEEKTEESNEDFKGDR